MMWRIYEVRPLICREFEMGEPDCVDERDKWFIKLNESAGGMVKRSADDAPPSHPLHSCPAKQLQRAILQSPSGCGIT
jgi:hypothetical protein